MLKAEAPIPNRPNIHTNASQGIKVPVSRRMCLSRRGGDLARFAPRVANQREQPGAVKLAAN
jgi:hypothetical protein